MIMGLSDVLALARTPEERKEMKESLIRLRHMKDEDIDFSDIPKVTDFTGWKRAKPYFDKIREHNLRIKAERERKKLESQAQ